MQQGGEMTVFFGKQKLNRDRGRGLCYRDQYRGLSKGIAGVVLACLATVSSFVNAAAVLTFYETEDGGLQAILTGSLVVPDSNIGTQTVRTENSARVKAGWELVYNWGTTDSLTKYEINFAGDWTPASSLTAYNSYDTTSVDGDPFQLYGRDGDRTRFLALDPNYVSGSELNATITWDNQDLQNQYAKSGFEALDVTSGTSFTYTLTGTDASNTFTVVFSADSPPSLAPVPLPASILFLGAGLGGFGLMGRLRRRKLVS